MEKILFSTKTNQPFCYFFFWDAMLPTSIYANVICIILEIYMIPAWICQKNIKNIIVPWWFIVKPCLTSNKIKIRKTISLLKQNFVKSFSRKFPWNWFQGKKMTGYKYPPTIPQNWMCERQPSSSVTIITYIPISYQLLLYYYMPYVFFQKGTLLF